MESFGSSENRFIAAGILSSLLLCSLALHGAKAVNPFKEFDKHKQTKQGEKQ